MRQAQVGDLEELIRFEPEEGILTSTRISTGQEREAIADVRLGWKSRTSLCLGVAFERARMVSAVD